jgi:hypothetical protein
VAFSLVATAAEDCLNIWLNPRTRRVLRLGRARRFAVMRM